MAHVGRVSMTLAAFLTLGVATSVLAQSAPVLGVAPEGAVIEAEPFPDLKPGARMGFRRPDAGSGLVGEGWVLDIREGRGLVGLKPGGTVQTGDLAVLCASSAAPGTAGDLRSSVQALKDQLSAAGGGW